MRSSRPSSLPRGTPWLVPFLAVGLTLGACGDDAETSAAAGATGATTTSSAGSGGASTTASSGATGGATSVTTASVGGAGGGLAGTIDDDFAGDGPLLGYTTNNPNALPDVARVGGRYRANLTDNTDNVTLHFNQDQGRLDAKLVSFPFDIVVRNIGIGTQGDSQSAPPPTSNPYIFAGVQVHVVDLDSRNSSHIVVGHRGSTAYTVEGKNTVDGDSSVNDVGANTVPDGRADIRVVGNADRTLTIYWQTPNPSPSSTADDWTLYNGTGELPGAAPSYGNQVYVGLITYAFNLAGVPFVGTCDAIESQ